MVELLGILARRGGSVATTTASGVDELCSGRVEEGAEEGEEVGREQRVRERGQGLRRLCGAGRRPGAPRRKQEVAEGSRARATPRLCLPGERKQVAGTGQHSAGPASGLPGGLRQVSGQVVCSFFYFFCV